METVMVVGTGFSGSTLLSMLLDAHPRMVGVGEAVGPYAGEIAQPDYECSCGERLAVCPFWRDVGAAMDRRGIDFGPEHWDLTFRVGGGRWANQLLSRSLRHNGLDAARDAVVGRVFGARLREVARRIEALAESACEVTGTDVFVDASKDPVRAWQVERLTNLRPHVLHLVRDSLGFVSSHVYNKKSSLDLGIRNWNRMAGHVERLFQRMPEERRLCVRYEDLCTDPEAELARIARFVGVEPMSGPIDLQRGSHVIGNKMRMANSSEIRLDERWRERLDADQVATVERRTARFRTAYGYA